MHFETGHIYHIFNQGNNRQRIFFKIENYYFFLEKIRTHVLPYADIMAYCLMPNHFHLMVYVNEKLSLSHESDSFTRSEAITNGKTLITTSEAITKGKTLNDSIGVMLRSYTRAINNQENRSGSLFKLHTKAECLTKAEGVTPSFYNTSYGAMINIPNPEKEYPQVCFNYIHNNPVKAGLVNNPGDWEFSSYQSYYGSSKVTLINKAKAKEFGLL